MRMIVVIVFVIILSAVNSYIVQSSNRTIWDDSGGNLSSRGWMNSVPGYESLLCSVDFTSIGSACSVSINTFCEALKSGEKWARRMFDSTVQRPTGVYGGQLIHLGHFDECLDIQNLDKATENFVGKYCLAEYSRLDEGEEVSNMDVHQIWHWLQQLEEETFLGKNYRHRAVLQTAWCVPSTCSNEELAAMLIRLVNNNNLKIAVPENKCQTADRTSLEVIDIISILILLIVVLAAILSTSYDVLTTPKESLLLHQPVEQRPKILLVFSIRENWKRIFAESNAENIKCVDGIRTLTIGWVVLGHTLLYFNGEVPSTNGPFISQKSQYAKYMGFVNAHLAADTFFLLSGFLVCYKFIGDVKQCGYFNVIEYYVHRFIRLTPTLAIMILLSASLLKKMGSGPLWYSVYDVATTNCKNNWWSTLLYVNNYVKPNNRCLPQTWYLAVDMQLFWLSPVVLIPLWKAPKFAKIFFGILLVIGIIIPFTIVYLMDIKAGNILFLNEQQFNRWNTSYYGVAYTRFCPWLIGVLLGYIVFNEKKTKQENKKEMSWPIVAAGWFTAGALMLASIYLLHPLQQNESSTPPESKRLGMAFYLALHRPAWALGVAWVVYACERGYAGFVNTILSWRRLQPVSRLSYGIFLTHVSVINLLVGLARTSVQISDFTTMQAFWIIFTISTLWALLLVLLFEFPSLALKRYIYGEKEIEDDNPLPELPPDLRSPVLFKRPSNIYALPDMIQVNDSAERAAATYSKNLHQQPRLRKPQYGKANSTQEGDGEGPSTPSIFVFDTEEWVNSHPEKFTNFSDLTAMLTTQTASANTKQHGSPLKSTRNSITTDTKEDVLQMTQNQNPTDADTKNETLPNTHNNLVHSLNTPSEMEMINSKTDTKTTTDHEENEEGLETTVQRSVKDQVPPQNREFPGIILLQDSDFSIESQTEGLGDDPGSDVDVRL